MKPISPPIRTIINRWLLNKDFVAAGWPDDCQQLCATCAKCKNVSSKWTVGRLASRYAIIFLMYVSVQTDVEFRLINIFLFVCCFFHSNPTWWISFRGMSASQSAKLSFFSHVKLWYGGALLPFNRKQLNSQLAFNEFRQLHLILFIMIFFRMKIMAVFPPNSFSLHALYVQQWHVKRPPVPQWSPPRYIIHYFSFPFDPSTPQC